MEKALILIDIQNDFISGSLAVPDAEAIISPVNEFISGFQTIVATQDWHPAHHNSFHTAHPGAEPFQEIEIDGHPQTLWPPHCVQGTTGADLHPALDLRPVSAIFRKGMNPAVDSYSAFFDNRRLRSTGLDGYLRSLGVDTLYVAGLAADFCVYYSILDALRLGYRVVLAEHLTRPISPANFDRQKHELSSHPSFQLQP